jgi:hypothetical protein
MPSLIGTLFLNDAMLVLFYLSQYGLPVVVSIGLVLSARNGSKGFLKLGSAVALSGFVLSYLVLNHSIYPLGDSTYGLAGQIWLLHAGLVVGALLAIAVKASRGLVQVVRGRTLQ